MNFTCILPGIILKSDKGFLLNIKICGTTSIILTLPTILLNNSLFIVLLKSKERSKPYNLFLLNLVVTDCICGYIILPFNSAFFFFISENRDPCLYSSVLMPFAIIVAYISFLSIFAITIDRYTAVFYPFFYDTRVNLRTTVVSVIIIWVLSIAGLTPTLSAEGIIFYRVSIILVGLILPMVNFYCYYRILTFTRRIRDEMNSTRRRFGGQSRRRESSLALTGALILVSMCICYLPMVIRFTIVASGVTSIISDYSQCWTWNLTTANSCLNACITCYQLSRIRRAVLELWGCKNTENSAATVEHISMPRNMKRETEEDVDKGTQEIS